MGAAAGTASRVERVDAFQRRHRSVGFPLAVVYKFVDDQGAYLTALITYFGFLSLFPLLLLMVTVLGYLLAGDAGLRDRLVDSALSRFPVMGDEIAENVTTLEGNRVALVVGILVSLYGGLGVAQALQAAFNRVWAVPRNARPNPLLARLRSSAMLLVIGAGVLASTVLSAVSAGADTLGEVGVGLGVLVALVGVAVNAGLFLLAFRLLTARDVPWAAHLPGAVGAAVVWQLLQLGGAYYVRHALAGASATYGAFGVVLGLIAWIYLGSLVVVLAAEVNVVRARRLWPRNLLTPFTDDVDLTRADERAYTSYARSERHKGFQTVDVEFDRDAGAGSGPDAGEDRPAHAPGEGEGTGGDARPG
jgi:YihY family inner membrane protein